jgi:hypothetical protein
MKTQSLDLKGMNLIEIPIDEKVTRNGGAIWVPFVVAAAVFIANKSYDQGQRDGRGDYCPMPRRRKP